MKKHKGEIIEMATRNSGYSLKKIAQRMGVSRSTLYNRFDDMDISDEFIVKLSRIIHHDFSRELPELKASEPHTNFELSEKSHKEFIDLQKKYCQILETHTNLLKTVVSIINTHESQFPELQKKLINLLESDIN